MTTLEIALCVTTVGFATLWVRSARKQMVVRHLFIQFSDWTATKINSMRSLAIEQEYIRQCSIRGPEIDIEEAMRSVNDEFLDASNQWGEQVDEIQRSLRRNGMSPLRLSDKDGPIMERWISGYKH